MLEVTLRSIARQTALDQIKEVIVSENLSDRRSGDVCAMFPELPIRYVLRDPELGRLHFETLFSEATAEFAAFVCDDDLWFPGHLESALRALDAHPEAAAHFSAFVTAKSELSADSWFWCAPLLWLAAGRPPRMSEYMFGHADVLALAWIITPFQWSTVVARTPAAATASFALAESPHVYYADRMFCVALSRLGPLVFDPAPDTLYRVCEGNWTQRQDPAELRAALRESDRLIAAESVEAGVDLWQMWRGYLEGGLPDEIAPFTASMIRDRFSKQELAENGLAVLLPRDNPPPLAARAVRRLRRAYRALMGRAV
jgi:hypothetical protein